ncbi:hypothetical protein [Paenibacillus sp. NEAU-GSW1]|uniref:hypothetical protein n=1 Tax=Paenibacillus sp. NEAU-GSW1 TaxID=2682486 RepID=UPI0012E25868|nr:hypothetical protein [Paenibacillus sp. NEAU-GSW1]MUT64428.1 hypothetical protein [Paenibacillus sp. NEAU-GSW1]
MEENRNDNNGLDATAGSNDGRSEQPSFYRPDDNPYASQPAFGSEPPVAEGKLKHSGLGIASFVLAIISILLGVLGIILSVVFVAQLAGDPTSFLSETESGSIPEGAGSILAAVVLMFLGVGISFVGLILGIVGVFAKNRRKLFAIIGLVFNGVIILGMLLMIVISLASRAAGI